MSHMGLPGYEREYTFDFDETTQIYAGPTDLMEALTMRYEDDTGNKRGKFTQKPGELLFPRIKRTGTDTRLYGIYRAAGSNQIIVLAKNLKASILIDSFDVDNDTTWTASNDATNVADDTVNFKEGSGSLKFDVDVSLSGNDRATLRRTVTSQDLSAYQDLGHFKIKTFIPSITNLTSFSIQWESSSGNYWKQTVTTQEDGSAFAANAWNDLDFDWDGATQVGTPDVHAIVNYQLDIDYGAGYVDQSNFRFDYLRLVSPDTIIMTYYTLYKGENNSGTALYDFTATTDVFRFDDFDTSIKELVALEASVLLNPQLLVDDTSVRRAYQEFTFLFSKRYPRKRGNNLLTEPEIARTSHD
jgi:hypothetical protein